MATAIKTSLRKLENFALGKFISGEGDGQILYNAITGDEIAITGQAQGDILYYDGAEWVRLAKGTALQILRTNAGLTAPEWASAGAMTLLSNEVLAATAQNFTAVTVDFTSSGYATYLIVVSTTKHTTNGAHSIIINGDTTATNYYTQNTGSVSTTVSGAATNNSVIGNTYPGGCYMFIWVTRNVEGYGAYVAQVRWGDTAAAPRNYSYVGNTKNTIANITSIQITSAAANILGVGSRCTVYGM